MPYTSNTLDVPYNNHRGTRVHVPEPTLRIGGGAGVPVRYILSCVLHSACGSDPRNDVPQPVLLPAPSSGREMPAVLKS